MGRVIAIRHNCLAVVLLAESENVQFVGTREECYDYMRREYRRRLDLRYAWRENGMIELLGFSSWMLD